MIGNSGMDMEGTVIGNSGMDMEGTVIGNSGMDMEEALIEKRSVGRLAERADSPQLTSGIERSGEKRKI